MRLIDADALTNAIEIERRYLIAREMVGAEHGLVHHVIPLVDDAPTIDAVPVIRCKDCKNWTEWGSRTGSCQRSDSVMWLGTDATDFCSFAERKDDE